MVSAAYWSQIGAAFALGALIGLERGWSQREATAGSRVAGLRTHVILALLGALAGIVATHAHWVFGLVILTACGGALVVGYRADAEQHGTLSVTSALVALLTLVLGLMTTFGYVTLALVVAAVVVAGEGACVVVATTGTVDAGATVTGSSESPPPITLAMNRPTTSITTKAIPPTT